ncbi:MAG: D-amino acid dehydrogenase small subunit [Rhodospirillaceae bacterium]|nr:D-amino acid dehydrogenase small subunit [Rhodospirillaceae bacterium]
MSIRNMRVIVLGAGVIGVTSAYFLARDGNDVTVIDRQQGPGMETSFANGGFVSKLTAKPWAHPSVPKLILKNFFREDAPYLFRFRADIDQWIWAARFLSHCNQKSYAHGRKVCVNLAKYSFSCLEEVRYSENIEYNKQSNGVLELYKTEESLIAASKFAKQLPDPEDHPEILDMDESKRKEPALTNQSGEYAGTLFYAGEETGDARKFTVRLAEIALNLGVKFNYGESINNVDIKNNNVTGVTTHLKKYSADAVVVCLGSYSRELLNKIRIKIPIYPLKGYSVTLPIRNESSAPIHGIHEISRRIVISRLGSRMRCAGTAELAGFDRSVNMNRTNSILEDIQKLFPDLTNINDAERWAGLRPMSPDCIPIVGLSKINGLLLNTGHGSTGWTWACGSGRIIADLIKGKEPELEISPLSPSRFSRS